MKDDVDYYLGKTVEELKSDKLKKEIINNNNQYMLTWFCAEASDEMVKALLDDEGIELLKGTDKLQDKINGILSSNKDINFFENVDFCELVVQNDAFQYVAEGKEESALTFFNYVYENYRDKIVDLYRTYYDDQQTEILESMTFTSDEKSTLLKASKKNSAEFLLTTNAIKLEDFGINILDIFVDRDVTLPRSVCTPAFIDYVAGINDVNRYRALIDGMQEYNDTSDFETRRKSFYEDELASIGEDGLLKRFSTLKEMIKSSSVNFGPDGEVKGFEGASEMIHKFMISRNLDEDIRRMNDYYISNMIIDYFFEDLPTNVLKNIDSLITYNDESEFLSQEEKTLYETLAGIDEMDTKHKIALFETLKERNELMTEKFYDTFSGAKERMANQINEVILTKDNVEKFRNEELSRETGVPIYYLTGEKYTCLVRNLGIPKGNILKKRNLDFMTDGSSFSVDGSNLLGVYGSNRVDYTLAYSGVPAKQLIHAFLTDSFTQYKREYENDTPPNKNPTERMIELHEPEQLTGLSKEYTELLISVPNVKKQNELEEQLEKPEAFAIYCYDRITQQDIDSAQELGFGIIVVDTEAYSIDKTGRRSMYDAMGKDRKKFNYAKHNEDGRKKYFNPYER